MGAFTDSTAKAVGATVGPGPRSKVVVMHPEWVRFMAHEARRWLEDLERMETVDVNDAPIPSVHIGRRDGYSRADD